MSATASLRQSGPADSTASARESIGNIRVGHVSLRVRNYAASLSWYRDVLGLPLVREWTEQAPTGTRQLCSLQLGQTQLELIAGGQPSERPHVLSVEDSLAHSGLAHLCLLVPSLAGAVEHLAERGVEPFAGPIHVPHLGLRLVLVSDNSHNVLELAEATSPSTVGGRTTPPTSIQDDSTAAALEANER